MKLNELKIGDIIQHYVTGLVMDAEVIEVLPNGVKTKHSPAEWAGVTYTESFVLQSLDLQMPISQTTPKAWHNGQLITI